MRLILASVLTFFFSRGFGISWAALRVQRRSFPTVDDPPGGPRIRRNYPRKKHACVVTGLNFEGSTDLEALNEQEEAVAALLKREKFKELDCLADAARSGQAKFPGGIGYFIISTQGLTNPPTTRHRNRLAQSCGAS